MYAPAEAPRIVRRYAGEWTGDTVFIWSDGVREYVSASYHSKRARHFRDRNDFTDPWVTYVYSPPTPIPEEEEKPRPRWVNPLACKKPWEGLSKPNLRPTYVRRPEFHARSNPRS